MNDRNDGSNALIMHVQLKSRRVTGGLPAGSWQPRIGGDPSSDLSPSKLECKIEKVQAPDENEAAARLGCCCCTAL